ncbi:MAG: PilZ domain-containing protein [Methylococcales bacterium]
METDNHENSCQPDCHQPESIYNKIVLEFSVQVLQYTYDNVFCSIMNSTEEEKRKYPRKKTAKILKVFDLNTEEYLGNLVDISLGGIMLVTQLDIKSNSVYQFRIDFPEYCGNQEPITFGGEILWIDARMDPNKKWIGIQIIDISEEMITRIDRLINDHL